MKDAVASLVNDDIKDLNVYVDDVIDLNKITEASRIINKKMDANESLLQDADELDIYSKEKGE